MKISELIEQLEKTRAEYGDLPAKVFMEGEIMDAAGLSIGVDDDDKAIACCVCDESTLDMFSSDYESLDDEAEAT